MTTTNPTMLQFFEWYCQGGGRHWSHLESEVPFIKESGFSSVWLPPAYKGTRGPTSEGYDVYDIYDLGEFNQKGSVATKYGTRQQYIDACRAVRSAGLNLIVDIVLNHMGGAEETECLTVREVDPDDRRKFVSDPYEIEAYTKFTFPGRKGVHSGFIWNKECFTGVDHAKGASSKKIYSICNKAGEGWEPLVDNEKGNFDYLMLNDIETRNPAVRQELKNWGKWYYNTVRFDGVRLDAVKHMNPSFFIEWLDYLRAEVNPQLFALGEYWLSDDLPVLLNYLDAVGDRMSLFDAPLHRNFSIASNQKGSYDLRTIFQDTLVSKKPDLAVTFVDNHDTQPLQSLEEYTEQWFKPHAYALILLRQDGYPCVFYADLFGTSYTGTRSNGDNCSIQIPVLTELPALLQARKRCAYGEQTDYFDQPDCIGWSRAGAEQFPDSGLAVLLSSSTVACEKVMQLGSNAAGRLLYNQLDPAAGAVQVREDGSAVLWVKPMAVAVWTFLPAEKP